MNTIIPALAGTLESSDVLVRIEPNGTTRPPAIVLTSSVAKQFSRAILATVQEVLTQQEIAGVDITIDDKGALDCVLRARLSCALARAGFPVRSGQ